MLRGHEVSLPPRLAKGESKEGGSDEKMEELVRLLVRSSVCSPRRFIKGPGPRQQTNCCHTIYTEYL